MQYNHADSALALFTEGYNCAQSVFASFCDVTRLSQEQALRLSSCFGGGIGRMREVCGTVSAMAMVLGLAEGYTDAGAREEKAALYAHMQQLANAFRDDFGSIVCRELLANTSVTAGSVPEARSAEYYHRRPCGRCVYRAAQLLDQYLQKQNEHCSCDGKA